MFQFFGWVDSLMTTHHLQSILPRLVPGWKLVCDVTTSEATF
jgi:hypothetical protein